MSGLSYAPLKRLLFRLDPERAHELTLGMLRLAGWFPPSRTWLRHIYASPTTDLTRRAMGIWFPNPIGLAAGYDKDGMALAGLASLGFGHLELGTVTPHRQEGQPRPRIFRLEEDRALVNHMGFPNRGVQAMVGRLRRSSTTSVIVGVNLGKGAETPLDRAKEDYAELLQAVYEVADYATINLSSPNTPGLRKLQAAAYLDDLLAAVCQTRRQLEASSGRYLPLAVKLSPDLAPGDLEAAVDSVVAHGLDGIVAVNTSRARSGLVSTSAPEAGGLSGRPLWSASRQMIEVIRARGGEAISVIGVGGIDSPERAMQMLDSGADLIQVYTGLIYEGPGLPASMLKGLAGRTAEGHILERASSPSTRLA